MTSLIGYARVSTDDQDLTIQRAQLESAGCTHIFAEKITGAHAHRPELAKMLDYLRSGDVVIITRLDRLARNTRDLLDIAEQLQAKDAGLRSLAEPWADTTSAAGRMVLTIFAGIAEFERTLIVERTQTGRTAARARGVRFGRHPILSSEQVNHARELLAAGRGIGDVAALFNVHRTTLQRMLKNTEDTVHF
jgi:DNA invertase Pin-like site-specific DNA recombinase